VRHAVGVAGQGTPMSSDRPILEQVLDQLCPGDTLVVWMLDRLAGRCTTWSRRSPGWLSVASGSAACAGRCGRPARPRACGSRRTPVRPALYVTEERIRRQQD
jgi:hypothetical protein